MVPKTPPTMSTDTDPQVVHLQTTSATGEKIDISPVSDHLERSRTGSDQSGNLVYQEEDKEPEIHLRTWVALGCMCLLLCVQSISLQGPPAVVSVLIAGCFATAILLTTAVSSYHSLAGTLITLPLKPGFLTLCLWSKQCLDLSFLRRPIRSKLASPLW